MSASLYDSPAPAATHGSGGNPGAAASISGDLANLSSEDLGRIALRIAELAGTAGWGSFGGPCQCDCCGPDAQRVSADAIVMGASSHGPVRSLMLGSVVSKVAQSAPVPVTVVK
jgi:hypothetical protein